jgi:hypothetical protein
MAKQNNSMFMEVSAKSGEGIEMMFMSLAEGKTMLVADDKDPLPPYTWGETTTDRADYIRSLSCPPLVLDTSDVDVGCSRGVRRSLRAVVGRMRKLRKHAIHPEVVSSYEMNTRSTPDLENHM